ncbi:MAG: type I-G CRISPR-associated protein Csb2 [Myxococcota bacterium]
MFTIEVELLTGRYVATAHDDRRRAEWPPHPARFFSALVAAHAEGERSEDERAALLWLERQPPPALEVSDATFRDVHDVFVPVNDVSPIGDLEEPLRARLSRREELRAQGAPATEQKKADKDIEKAQRALQDALAALQRADAEPSGRAKEMAEALLPERRTRQVRTFPVAIPDNSLFSFGWPEAPPPPVRAALDRLCERVTRLGHSSSLVWCRTTERALEPTWVPREDGPLVLRTVGAGQLERLDRAFEQHRGVAGRVLPALPQRYGRPRIQRPAVPHGQFASDDWILFERVGGARPLSSKGADLARALRAALLEQHGVPGMPAALSGHDPDGRPTKTPHLAFVALPWVGDTHADGSVKACAVIPPRGLSEAERQQLLRLVAQWEKTRAENGRLTLASADLKPMQFARVQLPTMKSSAPASWTRPSTRFVTATPIALDRNPGNLRSNFEQTAQKAAREAEGFVADACENIGLPRPKDVRVTFAPLLQGAQPAQAFRPHRGKPGAPPRVRVHAVIDFETPVQGPVLLGAGRHFGLGLCLPMEVNHGA